MIRNAEVTQRLIIGFFGFAKKVRASMEFKVLISKIGHEMHSNLIQCKKVRSNVLKIRLTYARWIVQKQVDWFQKAPSTDQ